MAVVSSWPTLTRPTHRPHLPGEAPCPPAPSCSSNPTPTTAESSIAKILTDAGYTVTLTADADEAFTQGRRTPAGRSSARSTGPKTPIDICREIRATPAMAAVPVMCISATEDVEERIAFLEAGADDVIGRSASTPASSRRGSRRCCCASSARASSPPIVTTDGVTMHRARRTVAVYSPKGGVGTTTIATNIGIAAVARRPDKVVLVDLALQFGGVATLLNLDPKQTLADVVRDEVGDARAGAAADLRDAPRQRPARPGRARRARKRRRA